MHEMTLTSSILDLLQTQARQQHFSMVKRIRLEVGALVHFEPEALQFNFNLASRGTLAEGAVLEIVIQPGRAWCPACEREVAMSTHLEPCPECGTEQLRVISGDQFHIKELEVA